MNLKQVEIIGTIIRSPLFAPQKTKAWPLLSRKNLPQSEFITLKKWKGFFYGKSLQAILYLPVAL